MNEPIETAELLAFIKIVDAKSMSRAARELGGPRATISRRLARLEQRLGVQLLRRTTRSLVVTDAGEAFYRQARLALDAVTQAEQSVRQLDAVVKGALRITIPPMVDTSFNEMVCAFARTYPEVQVHVFASTKYVDLLREGYDVAIRASTKLEPGLVARTLHRSSMIAVAAPKYLASSGTPRSARELRGHRCLMGFARGELPETHWPLTKGQRLRIEGVFASNDLSVLCDAARAGLGIALLPTQTVAHALRRGELVQVLAGVVEADVRVSVVYPQRELVPSQVRAFVDAVVSWAKQAAFVAAEPKAKSTRKSGTKTDDSARPRRVSSKPRPRS